MAEIEYNKPNKRPASAPRVRVFEKPSASSTSILAKSPVIADPQPLCKSKRPISAPRTYSKEKAPFQKNKHDKEKWREIDQQNKLMARKLKDIKREPPANYHAPAGFSSLRDGTARKAAHDSKKEPAMTGTIHYVPPTPWPPTPVTTTAINRKEKNRDVRIENERIAGMLHETYKHRKDTLTVANKLSNGVDCNPQWSMRTSIYAPADRAHYPRSSYDDPQFPVASSCAGFGAVSQPGSVGTGVPKSLGVAHCGGCGAKGFYNADGVRLTPCKSCKQVFYCSDTCAKLDWPSHKALCKYSSNGHWGPHGSRPADEYWVKNAAMAKARKVAARTMSVSRDVLAHADIDVEFELQEALAKLVLEERKKEMDAERRQAMIEKRAMDGMDGPRPCMYENGKLIGDKGKAATRKVVRDEYGEYYEDEGPGKSGWKA